MSVQFLAKTTIWNPPSWQAMFVYRRSYIVCRGLCVKVISAGAGAQNSFYALRSTHACPERSRRDAARDQFAPQTGLHRKPDKSAFSETSPQGGNSPLHLRKNEEHPTQKCVSDCIKSAFPLQQKCLTTNNNTIKETAQDTTATPAPLPAGGRLRRCR
jgi:hypothetical protein